MFNARYWPKNTQLVAISSIDASIKQYPEKFDEVVKRFELFDEAAVVLAGLNQVCESQRRLAKELQETYTDAMDEQKRVPFCVKYAEHRILGFNDDL